MLGECVFALDQEYLNETKKQAAMKASRNNCVPIYCVPFPTDLRTPLTSISGGAVDMLMSSGILWTKIKGCNYILNL